MLQGRAGTAFARNAEQRSLMLPDNLVIKEIVQSVVQKWQDNREQIVDPLPQNIETVTVHRVTCRILDVFRHCERGRTERGNLSTTSG
jgi:hypothetical protein